MPTKPEGPAQEPATVEQVRDAIAHGGDHRDIINRPEPVPATPAPSQPAGAREFLLERGEWNDAGNSWWFRQEQAAERMEAYAAQQTAAKDAALKAAERERDSLREAVQQAHEALANRPMPVRAFKILDAALKAGKDGQQ